MVVIQEQGQWHRLPGKLINQQTAERFGAEKTEFGAQIKAAPTDLRQDFIDCRADVVQQPLGAVILGVQRQPGDSLPQRTQALCPDSCEGCFAKSGGRLQHREATLQQLVCVVFKAGPGQNASTTAWGRYLGGQQQRQFVPPVLPRGGLRRNPGYAIPVHEVRPCRARAA